MLYPLSYEGNMVVLCCMKDNEKHSITKCNDRSTSQLDPFKNVMTCIKRHLLTQEGAF